MENIRGGMAGLLTGILLSPIFCIFTFVAMFFLGILTLTNVSFLKDTYELLISCGNPYVWTVLITCFVCTTLGFFRKWRFFSFWQGIRSPAGVSL